jgi:high-affinity nickel-transport protein
MKAFGPRAVSRVFDDSPGDVRGRIAIVYAVLAAVNAAAWVLTFAAFHGHPLLLGTAVLAYTFGLRHAVDADHIAAIDNVTRKLMQDGKRPVTVGFFFSLGHSTIVVALSAGIAVSAGMLRTALPGLQAAGETIGTAVSAAFLFGIAAINLVVFVDVVRALRAVRRGEPYADASLDDSLARRGLVGRLLRPVVRGIESSRQMYPLGLLFGLGFDTATEVGLLGIAALEAGNGLPVYAIMLFPLLFTAGMSLLDTTDGVLMLGAYGWAFVKPARKLYYNLNVTLLSVLTAIVVGAVEVFGIIGERFGWKGAFWNAIGSAGQNFGTIGFAIVGVFAVSWLVSAVAYKLGRYDEIDAASSP